MDIFGVHKQYKMKNKILVLGILVLILSCVILYFNFNNYSRDISTKSIDEYNEIDLNFDGQLMSYMAIWEDFLIYQHIDGDSGKYYIGKYNLNNSEHSIIGYVNNIVTSSDKIMLIDDVIYTHMILMKDNILVNTLIAIDLKSESIEELVFDTDYVYPAVNIINAKEKIASLKQKNSEGVNVSYYEIFNPRTNNVDNRVIFPDDVYAVTNCKYNNNIYVLELYENNKFRISLYDEDFNYKESFDMDKIKDICNSLPYKIVVYKDIVYIRNTSDQMAVGRLTNGTVMPIYYGENTDIMHSCYNNLEPIFYKRFSDEYYTVDFEKYTVKSQNINLPDNYNIQYMISGDNVFLVLVKSDKEEKEIWYKCNVKN